MIYALLIINVCNSFIPVINLNTLIFKSYVLFGAPTLLEKPLRVLQLPAHLLNLTENG